MRAIMTETKRGFRNITKSGENQQIREYVYLNMSNFTSHSAAGQAYSNHQKVYICRTVAGPELRRQVSLLPLRLKRDPSVSIGVYLAVRKLSQEWGPADDLRERDARLILNLALCCRDGSVFPALERKDGGRGRSAFSAVPSGRRISFQESH